MEWLAQWISESLEWLYECLLFSPLHMFWEIFWDLLRQTLIFIIEWIMDVINSTNIAPYINNAGAFVEDSLVGLPQDMLLFLMRLNFYDLFMNVFMFVVPAIVLYKIIMQIVRG